MKQEENNATNTNKIELDLPKTLQHGELVSQYTLDLYRDIMTNSTPKRLLRIGALFINKIIYCSDRNEICNPKDLIWPAYEGIWTEEFINYFMKHSGIAVAFSICSCKTDDGKYIYGYVTNISPLVLYPTPQ